MLDGLLGRGFSPKCKSLIKATKTRIEVLRRRAEAKQRFLKEDLAKLLANGLDINAFGRTEEFLAGMCLLSCYDFIEYSCEYILKWLSTMQKQRECPEECREPVSSLIFAAARFSDLPELRDLRDAFQERYGNSLEYFANHVFVEKLASRPPTMEKKLQLLQDIASEFSIKWDSKGFEKRMANPPAFTQNQPRKYGAYPFSEDKYKLSNGNSSSLKTDKQETTSNGHKSLSSKAETISKRDANEISFRGRREFTAEKHASLNDTEDTSSSMTVRSGSSSSRGKRSEYVDGTLRNDRGIIPKGERKDPLSRGKGSDREYPATLNDWVTAPKGEAKDPLSRGKGLDRVDGGYPMALSDWVTAPKGEMRDPLPRRKGSDRVDGGYPTALNDWVTASKGEIKDPPSRGKGSEQVDGRYLALNDRATVPKRENDPPSPGHAEDRRETPKSYYSNALPPPYVKAKDNPNPPYIRPKGTNYGTRTDSEHAGFDSGESSVDPTPRSRAKPIMSSCQKEPDQDHQNHIPLPKPRSVRRKHSKSSSSNYEDTVYPEDGRVVKRTSSSRRKEHSKKGLQILFDDEHYQKDEEERMMDKLLLHYSKKSSNFDITKLRKKSEVDRMGIGSDPKPEIVPTRSISLPHVHELPTPSDGPKVFARASSFHPDGQAPHVHPKLPDYDELAARFTALRGR